ncbi:MAG: hypothetical protein J6W69_08180, partial [Bacteroidales bacterium]|nr:hypothetical protein [Bacteroidales bacterium]
MRQIFTAFLLGLSATIGVQAREEIALKGFRLATQAKAPTARTEWTYECYSKEFLTNPIYAQYHADSAFLMT